MGLNKAAHNKVRIGSMSNASRNKWCQALQLSRPKYHFAHKNKLLCKVERICEL